MVDPTPTRLTDAERVADVLRTHFLHSSMNLCGPLSPPADRCRWRPTSNAGSLVEQYRAHFAETLARVVAAARADERERALTEAADTLDGRWTRNIGGHPYSDRDRGIREAGRVVRALAQPADTEGGSG